ncbi:glycosyltransferase family 2 protein [Candidatus Poribacteria bacterium]|nr:glycosyltransferase family 2 protein [Candidatus Poribacteria bacterium]
MSSEAASATPGGNPPVSLVVLTWNGKHLLEECFPSVVAAAGRYSGETELIVVDNGSTDGSVEFIRERFPKVCLISLRTNTGFQVGSNTGVKAAKHGLVFLLNNDILLDADCIAPLARHFTNEKLFAVGPLMLFPCSSVAIYSCSGVRFSRGELLEEWAISNGVDLCGRVSPTLYLSGGAMMFQKQIFEELGFFDALYNPFSCEDLDICYRAWKMGYYMLYEPASIVYHKHSATIPKVFSRRYYDFIMRRNKFILMWRNITGCRYLVEHLTFLVPRIIRRWMNGNTLEIDAFLMALLRVPRIVARRLREKKGYVRSDAEICGMLSIENLLSPGLMFEIGAGGIEFKDRSHIHETESERNGVLPK